MSLEEKMPRLVEVEHKTFNFEARASNHYARPTVCEKSTAQSVFNLYFKACYVAKVGI